MNKIYAGWFILAWMIQRSINAYIYIYTYTRKSFNILINLTQHSVLNKIFNNKKINFRYFKDLSLWKKNNLFLTVIQILCHNRYWKDIETNTATLKKPKTWHKHVPGNRTTIIEIKRKKGYCSYTLTLLRFRHRASHSHKNSFDLPLQLT